MTLLAGCFAEPGLVSGAPTGTDEGSTDAADASGETTTKTTSGSGDAGSTGGSGSSASSAAGATSWDTSTSGDSTSDGATTGAADSESSGDVPRCEGRLPDHEPCDAGVLYGAAVGLGCPDEPPAEFGYIGGLDGARLRQSFGPTPAFYPEEGERFLVLGTGDPAALDEPPGSCSMDIGDYDPVVLPAPLRPEPSSGSCVERPDLVGSGDCSGTLSPLSPTPALNDVSRVRAQFVVPEGADGITLSTAFVTTEYGSTSPQPDFFVAWLESEAWTGNIVYGVDGLVSTSSSLLTLRDDAPELEGTCAEGHAATPWLRTAAPAVPGESIELVVAVFDVGDDIQDSFVFLDAVAPACTGARMPETTPAR